jgi:hypothetical protein
MNSRRKEDQGTLMTERDGQRGLLEGTVLETQAELQFERRMGKLGLQE